MSQPRFPGRVKTPLAIMAGLLMLGAGAWQLALSPLTGFGLLLLGLAALALRRRTPLARAFVAAVAITSLVANLMVLAHHADAAFSDRVALHEMSPLAALFQGVVALVLGGYCLRRRRRGLRDCRITRLTHRWTAAVIVAGLLLTFGFAWGDAARVQYEAKQELANLSRLMEEHMYRSLDPVELVLRDLQARTEAEGIDALSASETEWQRLAALTESLPQLNGLVLFDADGQLRRATPVPVEHYQSPYFAWREFFQAHAMGAQYYLGSVIQTQLDSVVFTTSYRLSDDQGNFAGVILAGLDVDYFTSFYRSLALEPGAALSLVRRDGRPLVREPLVEDFVDRDLATHPIYARLLHHVPSGFINTPSPYDDNDQLIHFRVAESGPFVVQAAIGRATLSAPLQRRLIGSLLLLLAIVTLALTTAGSQLKAAGQARRMRGVLEEQRRFTRAVIDSMSAAVAVLDRQGRIIDVNSRWGDFIRCKPDEQARDSVGGDYGLAYAAATDAAADQVEAVEAGIAAVAAGEQPLYETLFEGADTRWFTLRVTPLGDGSGAVVVCHENVTDLKRAELAALTSERQIAEIAATVPGILYQWYCRSDGETGFHYLSPRTQEFYGFTPQDLAADWVNLFHPQDQPGLMASIDAAVASRSVWTFEGRAVAKDGTVRWTRTVAQPVRESAEEVVYSGFTIDITTEYQARQAVAESERRYRALIEGSVQGILVQQVHKDFRPLFLNDAAAGLFGYASVDEAVAESSWAHLLPEATRAKALACWQQLSDGSQRHVHARAPHLRRDGSRFWAELTARRVEWQGEPAMQLTLLDVTERHALEAELEKLATTDSLTGLLNRGEFSRRAALEVRRRERHPQPLCTMMLDIDHFKRVNDTYGHAAGDAVLRALAQVIARSVREVDLVGRFGGEEFVALLGSGLAEARVVAERIRQAVEEEPLVVEGQRIAVTISLGLACYDPGEPSIEPALQRADRALYAAKHAGRNRVVAADCQVA